MATYGLDDQIFDWHICSGNDCDGTLDRQSRHDFYMGGPPYILHRNDWAKMVDGWVDLSEKAWVKASGSVSTTFVHTNAEMDGFILSSAAQGLRYRVDNRIMASDPHIGPTTEQWEFPEVVIMHYAHTYGYNEKSSKRWHRWSKHNHPHDLLINCETWNYFDVEKYMAQWELRPKHKFAMEHSLVTVNRAVRAWRDLYGCGQLQAFCPYNDACQRTEWKR